MFGAKFAFMQRVTGLRRDRAPASSSSSSPTAACVRTRAVLLAIGASYRRLGHPRARGARTAPASTTAGRHPRLRACPAATSTSSAAPTPPGRPRSISPATRGTSRSSCAATHSRPACPTTWSARSSRPRTSRCALGTEVVGGGGDGRLEQLVAAEPPGRRRGDRRRRRAVPAHRCATAHRVAAVRGRTGRAGFVLTGPISSDGQVAARARAVPARDERARRCSPRATCAMARSSGWRQRSGRGPSRSSCSTSCSTPRTRRPAAGPELELVGPPAPLRSAGAIARRPGGSDQRAGKVTTSRPVIPSRHHLSPSSSKRSEELSGRTPRARVLDAPRSGHEQVRPAPKAIIVRRSDPARLVGCSWCQ